MTVLTPEQFGAVGDGVADDTAAFQAMFNYLWPNHLVIDPGATYQYATDAVIELDGRYKITGTVNMEPLGFGGAASGLVLQGANKTGTEIITTSANPLFITDNRWKGLTFRDIRFRSTNAAGKFMYSYTTGNVHDFVFDRCEWRGTWEYGLGLDGNNCNSEFAFNNCEFRGSYSTGFLYGGMNPAEPQQDQFLNYWFNQCRAEYEWGNLVRMVKGGFVIVNGGSYIITGQNPDGVTKSRFFYMGNGASHYDAVACLAVRDVRFELRNSLTQAIYTDRYCGQIIFDHCSDIANGSQAHSPSLIAHEHKNQTESIRYLSCELVGKHKYQQDIALGRQKIVYDQCARKNNRTEASFITKTGAFAASVNIIHRDDVDAIPEG